MNNIFYQIPVRIRFALADVSGATAIEYCIIGGFLSIVIVGTVAAIGGSVTGMYNSIVSAFVSFQ